MRNRIGILFFSLVASFSTLAHGESNRLQFYYHIAEGNYLIGDASGAERTIEQILRLDPTHAPALALRARILLYRGEPDRALDSAQKAALHAPEELKYTILEALILGNLGQRGAALETLNTVISRAKSGSEDAIAAQQLKGLMNMAEGNWDEAAQLFKSIYSEAPENSETSRQLAIEAYLEKAQNHFAKGAYETTIDSITQAIKLYQNATGSEAIAEHDRLRLLRAKTRARIGQADAAITELSQLAARSPIKLEAITTLASIYATKGRWDSIDGLLPQISDRPELSDIVLYLEGRVALARGRVGTARQKFEEALELQIQKQTTLGPTLLFYQGLCLRHLERHEAAHARFAEAIDQGFEPETIEEATLIGEWLLQAGKPETAIPLLEKTLLSASRSNESARVWSLLGRAHTKSGSTTLAISALNEALAYNPRDTTALAMRGAALRRIGDLEGALADYRSALQNLPSSPVLSYEIGLVLLQMGNMIEAEASLSIAARKLATHVTLDLLHASCAYAIGLTQEASASLNEYLNPELSGEVLSLHDRNHSDTAFYLSTLLPDSDHTAKLQNAPRSDAVRLFEDYTQGKASRKQVLDWAGRASTPELARSQICAAAYWLSEYERQQGDLSKAKELRLIALDAGSPENPEWQFARWQHTKPEK